MADHDHSEQANQTPSQGVCGVRKGYERAKIQWGHPSWLVVLYNQAKNPFYYGWRFRRGPVKKTS